jgi:tetratricopeptide (TPR) repeat protein
MATISEALATAVQRHQAGRLQAAEQIYRQILAVEPNQPDALHLLGVVASQTGRHEMAVECIERAIGLQGNEAAFHNNLGEAYRGLYRLPEAVACCRRALELRPDFAEAHYNLGNALRDQGKHDDAIACYRRALELKPDYAKAHNNLGNSLKDAGRLEEALACYRRALELKPDFAEAHGNLGSAWEEIGDLLNAERSFRAALQHDPRFAFAHHKLAELLGGELPESDLNAQHRLLEESDLTDSQRMLLHFGLARVLDARGEFAEAAGHLDRANALQLANWRKRGQFYDSAEHDLFIARTIAACTADFLAGIAGFGLESELPVFIVGLPRSGTTLVEQILASHSRVFGAGEIKLSGETMSALGEPSADLLAGLRRLDRQTVHRLGLGHLEKLRSLAPTALRIVDKMPDNYLYLGPLAALFPRARFIHCRRDLRDVAVSCWMTHFRDIPWANDQGHIASRFLAYERLMTHWRSALPAPMLELDYEETVADMEGAARTLVAWCGLDWEPACLDFHLATRTVQTASAVQVRRPVFKSSVGRWKHYERALGVLFTLIKNADVSSSIS